MADLNSTLVRGNLRVTEDAQISGSISEGGTLLSNKYQAKLPTTTTAGKVLKSTSTAGTVEWADDSNTNTWRNIKVDNVEKLGTGTGTGALNFVSQNTNNGDITFTYDGGIKATAKFNIGDAVLTIKQNNTSVGTFTANSRVDASINIVTPQVYRYI